MQHEILMKFNFCHPQQLFLSLKFPSFTLETVRQKKKGQKKKKFGIDLSVMGRL